MNEPFFPARLDLLKWQTRQDHCKIPDIFRAPCGALRDESLSVGIRFGVLIDLVDQHKRNRITYGKWKCWRTTEAYASISRTGVRYSFLGQCRLFGFLFIIFLKYVDGRSRLNAFFAKFNRIVQHCTAIDEFCERRIR